MAIHDHYRRQVALLIRVLPPVAEEQVFALKGGTAINLFVRDLPRLSVDIDLTYLPVAGRPESLAAIDAAMRRIAERITVGLPGIRVQEATLKNEDAVNKLFVRDGDVQVKIEVTPVASPHFSPAFVARASRRRCGGSHGLNAAVGVAVTTSKRREGVRPATPSGSAAAAEGW